MDLPHARALPLTGADQAVRASPAIYCGFAVQESGGTNPVTVRIYDNASAASGTLIDTVNLAAGGSEARMYNRGLWCENGIFVDVGGTGTVAGSIRIG